MFKHEVAQFVSLSIPAWAMQVHHICVQDLTCEVTKTKKEYMSMNPVCEIVGGKNMQQNLHLKFVSQMIFSTLPILFLTSLWIALTPPGQAEPLLYMFLLERR